MKEEALGYGAPGTITVGGSKVSKKVKYQKPV
jgi:hypothetical protein